jgi:hypothetical protein
MARRDRGAVLVLAALLIFAVLAAMLLADLALLGGSTERDRQSDRALAQAREALIAYAADRPINASVGPGYLPCPDLDDDGWAESTCGSLSGDSGQQQRIGRLPWKTLGLADLRDGYGERLWYAVSSKYKGLLNCGASRACVDMTPDSALGTISVREASGALLHDGTIAEPYRANEGGAVAVVIAPGPPLARIAADGAPGEEQSRDCAPGDCDSTGRCVVDPPQKSAHCDPAAYLDKAPGARFADEDNADFVDRNDAAGRARNVNGFIHGPVVLADGRIAVNDRLAVISYRDVMPRIMARVALEVAHCLRFYASRPENGGRLPWASAVCLQDDPSRADAWRGASGVRFGRVPDTPFDAVPHPMLSRWWRAAPRAPENLSELPTQEDVCRIAVAPSEDAPRRSVPPPSPDDEGETAGASAVSWWTPWRPYVFYAIARAYTPSSGSATCDTAPCLQTIDATGRVIGNAKQFALIVAGARLASDRGLQDRSGAHLAETAQWLEEGNARLESSGDCPARAPAFPCDAFGTCDRITAAPATRAFNDVVLAFP